MTDKSLPSRELGYVLPVMVGDGIHYQFYRVCPSGALLVCYPIGLKAFTAEGAEAALEQFRPAVDFLAERGVDRITQGGIPISAYVGRKRILALVEEAERRTNIPCSADFEESIEALQSLGARKIALAAKWSPELMSCVVDYLGDAGISVLGYVNDARTADQVVRLGPEEGVEIALAIGRKALQENPGADALLLAGGAWLSLHAIPILEAEFGVPVVTNPQASYWAALRQFNMPAAVGYGRVLDGLASR
jgi:arylmalonate decarboxylase